MVCRKLIDISRVENREHPFPLIPCFANNGLFMSKAQSRANDSDACFSLSHTFSLALLSEVACLKPLKKRKRLHFAKMRRAEGNLKCE